MHKLQTRVTFEAAHRLYNVDTYSEECRKNLHGHSYAVTIIVARDELNSAGMVMDFKLLKKIIKGEIEDKYDHACILRISDPLADVVYHNCDKVHVVESNPTAEWMAEKFAKYIQAAIDEVDSEVRVVSVAVQETENNIAIYGV